MDWKDVLKNDVEKGFFSKFPNDEAQQFYERELQNAIHFGGDPYKKKAFIELVKKMPKANKTIDGIRLALKQIGSTAHGLPKASSPAHDEAMRMLEEQRNPPPSNFGVTGSDPARNLTNPYKKMLKGSKPMNRWGPIIDEIMSDGYNRTSRGIIESLYNHQNDKKASTRNIPTQKAISMYLKSNPEYIRMGSSSYGTEYRLKDAVTKLMKGMETATRSAELWIANDYDLNQMALGYIKSLVQSGHDKAKIMSKLSAWLPNMMVHHSGFMDELEGYGEIDAISDVEWANVAETFADHVDDLVEDLQ